MNLGDGADVDSRMPVAGEEVPSPKHHPLDEWVEITALGAAAPQYVLAINGREVSIAKARELYALGRVSLDEFERLLDEALA